MLGKTIVIVVLLGAVAYALTRPRVQHMIFPEEGTVEIISVSVDNIFVSPEAEVSSSWADLTVRARLVDEPRTYFDVACWVGADSNVKTNASWESSAGPVSVGEVVSLPVRVNFVATSADAVAGQVKCKVR